MNNQLDIFRDSAELQAAAFRAAAETARVDPHYTTDEQQRRADYYEQRAKELESRSCA